MKKQSDIHSKKIILDNQKSLSNWFGLLLYSHLSGHDEIINPSPLSAVYMRQWNGSALVQVMVCRLIDAKPLPDLIVTYCQLNKLQWNLIGQKFHSWKCIWICRLWMAGGWVNIIKICKGTLPDRYHNMSSPLHDRHRARLGSQRKQLSPECGIFVLWAWNIDLCRADTF